MKELITLKEVLSTYKKPRPSDVQQYKNLLPIKRNSKLALECAFLIGKIIGDGNLDSNFTPRFIGQKEDLSLLKDLIIDKFKLNNHKLSIKRRVHKGISYLLQVNCSFLGRILYALGAPMGDKTKIAFKIPPWILEDKNCKKYFLQALLEDELTTIKIEKCNYSVKPKLKLAKKLKLINDLNFFMSQVKKAIGSLGIECSHISKPIEGIKTWELYFHINRNKKNIMKFKENLGFRLNQNKIKNLNFCYNQIKKSLH